jgi:hypothetical protein
MEDPLQPLQPLADKVTAHASEVAKKGHQQEALNLVLLHIEQSLPYTGTTPSAPPAPNIDKQMETQEDVGGSNSVASPSTPADEDINTGNFLLTYHKIVPGDPLPWLNRCEHYFCVC